MESIVDLNELFIDMLHDIYYAEKKILKALPKMCKALEKGSQLTAAFEKHYEETIGQVERLDQVFEIIGEKPKAKKCDAIEGISQEADDLMEEVEDKAVLEAGLLAGAQAVEHYEMARYGTLIEWAKVLGYNEAAKLLHETLQEEKKTDQLLNKLAVSEINRRAAESAKTSQDEDGGEREKTSRSASRRHAA